MRAYVVIPHEGADWQVVVAAYTAQQAKRMAFRQTGPDPWSTWEWREMRVRWARGVSVPFEVERPAVDEDCGGAGAWTCPLWSHAECGACARREVA